MMYLPILYYNVPKITQYYHQINSQVQKSDQNSQSEIIISRGSDKQGIAQWGCLNRHKENRVVSNEFIRTRFFELKGTHWDQILYHQIPTFLFIPKQIIIKTEFYVNGRFETAIWIPQQPKEPSINNSSISNPNVWFEPRVFKLIAY